MLISIFLFLFAIFLASGVGENGATNPPSLWRRDRRHNENLSRIYFDDHIAVYRHLNSSVAPHLLTLTWSSSYLPISQVWKYVKETYGPIGPDPRLYFLFHDELVNSHQGCSNLFYNQVFKGHEQESHDVIDCGPPDKKELWTFKTNTSKVLNYQRLIYAIARFSEERFKGTDSYYFYPGYLISQWKMTDILYYDLFLRFGNQSDDLDHWMKEKLMETVKYPREGTNWFRNWFFPIYEKFGGSSALNSFFNFMYTYWPRNGTRYLGRMNLGQFVHFWNGATGADLRPLANNTFCWDEELEEEFFFAQRDFSHFYNFRTVTEGNTTIKFYLKPTSWQLPWKDLHLHFLLVYSHGNVNYFLDSITAGSVPTLKNLSLTWNYIVQNYGIHGKDSILNVILERGGRFLGDSSGSGCISSNNFTSEDQQFDNHHVIHCEGLDIATLWTPKVPYKSEIIQQIVFMGLKISKGIGNWPAYEVSRWTMASILLYDVNLAFQSENSSQSQVIKEFFHRREKNIHWFRDWYYPIYILYGGSTVLNNFLSLLGEHWPRNSNRQDYSGQLNMGEFVHFWSGAAGTNLKKLAAEVFGWSGEREIQLQEARANHSRIFYRKDDY